MSFWLTNIYRTNDVASFQWQFTKLLIKQNSQIDSSPNDCSKGLSTACQTRQLAKWQLSDWQLTSDQLIKWHQHLSDSSFTCCQLTKYHMVANPMTARQTLFHFVTTGHGPTHQMTTQPLDSFQNGALSNKRGHSTDFVFYDVKILFVNYWQAYCLSVAEHTLQLNQIKLLMRLRLKNW